jgi:hypothetical protein
MIPVPYLIAGSLALGGLGGWVANGWRLGERDATRQLEQAQHTLEQMQFTSGLIAERAREFTRQDDTLGREMTRIRKELRNALHTPLPDGCRPDPERMRVLQQAVTAANAAARPEPGPPLRPD